MDLQFFNKSNGSVPSHGRCTYDIKTAQVVFPILYILVFCLGLILNILSLWVFCRVPSNSVFIIYLKNTVVADIVMTLSLPFKIVTDSRAAPWQVKAFVCRFSAVVFYASMYINIILLGLIGLDRFLKIVRPYERGCMDQLSVAKRISVAVWFMIFGISIPNMILSNQTATPKTVRQCSDLKSPLGIKWHVAVNFICLIIFWSVLIALTIFYTIITKKVYESYRRSRSRHKDLRRTTRVKVFVVVIVFFVCFAPYHFMRLPYTFSQSGVIDDCNTKRRLFLAKESTLLIAATNVFMDPLIYIILCKPFRKLLPGFLNSGDSSQEAPINNESTV
ncbi:P2Y purinoceptor 13 [Hyperolius riggenbachi]|uniref:P2Y purinoceptor 13 n=1 Tax=Hyperolius riggenbachi TaxID=752182 RepID=UPI0035A2B804